MAGRSRLQSGPDREVELVSVDSMAVYRGMDIGTTKPSAQVRAAVGYHLVDLVEACQEFTVQQFQAAAHGNAVGSADHRQSRMPQAG